MNIFIKSFPYQRYAEKDSANEQTKFLKNDWETNFICDPSQILSILVSATCIGNDGRSNCPLFHGSLAPMIFGKSSDENMRRLLLRSNNITWTQTVFWRDSVRFPAFQKEIFEALSKTRYSSKSLKKLQVKVNHEEDKQNLLSFLQTGCQVLETLEIHNWKTLSLQELASCPALTNSLNRFEWACKSIPDSQQLQHFNRLQELCLFNTSINDEQLHPLASLKNLRRLELDGVRECTGSFLDVVCHSLERLRILEIAVCSDFTRVSGLKHLTNSLEELSLFNVPRLDGHEEWVEFPFLKKLTIMGTCFIDHQEKLALSSDAFPSLDELELDIQNASHPIHTKIFESCQQESSAPMKRVNIRNGLAKAELEALLMVPVEELNLHYTRSIKHLCSDIPWSEEKIITKTLKKFTWVDFDDVVSSIAFLINCKQLESLELYLISPNIDLSALSNLPRLKELSFKSPAEEGKKLFAIKDLFRSADENNAVVFPSLQKLELIYECAISRFEGLENILPNLRILESSVCVDSRENDKNLLTSFLYLVRNFQKLEEIRFSGQIAVANYKIFKPMNTRIPRLLKKEKPSLIIYYPGLCQYEPERKKEETRRDLE